MRTPKPGISTQLTAAKTAAKTAAAVLYPWGQALVRAWVQKKARIAESEVRTTIKALARKLYPAGKALARVRYFEMQRGLPPVMLPQMQPPPTSLTAAQSARTGKARKLGKHKAQLRYASTAAQKQHLKPKFAAAANLPVWRELGPTLIPHGQTYGQGPNSKPSVSGRCVGIVVDPADRQHLVLCSAGGGLWGSQDSGATWRPLTDQQPTLAMGALALAPSSPNIMYAGTGEGDGQVPLCEGLLRSSDGGQTWTHAPSSVLAGEGLYDIAVDPGNPMHLWIGGTSGLYESTDGGVTVSRVRTGQTWDIAINPNDAREIFVGSAAGLLKSTNGGGTWTRVSLSGAAAGAAFDRIEVCHAPSNPAIVFAAAAVNGEAMLWRRASAGGGFRRETTPANMDISQAWYDWCLAIAPNDPDSLYWGAIELYHGTRTAGKFRWSKISSRNSGDSIHPDQHHLAFDPGDPLRLYACNDGGLFRSPDGGTQWESLNPGLGITEFEFLAQLESDSSWLIGGTQDNGTIGNAGNKLWNQIALGDGGDCGAADSAEPLCFHSYYGIWIERAPAKGADAFNWKDVSPPAPNDYPALFYPPMDVRGALVSKAGSTLFVSPDSGETWQEVELPTSSAVRPDLASALTSVDSRTILLGTVQGRLYRITRGSSWANAQVTELTSPRAAFISDIVVVPGVSPVLWVSCSTLSGGHVFRSTDGGQTWTDRSGNLPNTPVNAIVVDPANSKVVYAASDHGVYRTSNAGQRWIDYSNGLPNVIVGDLILHETERRLRAGTRSRGVWDLHI